MLKDLWKVLIGELSSKALEEAEASRTGFGRQVHELMQAKHSLQDANLRLSATIRKMDQDIWTMSQQPTWERMRPHFVKLQEGMEARKSEENRRIQNLMVGEIINVYGKSAPEEIKEADQKYLQGPSS